LGLKREIGTSVLRHMCRSNVWINDIESDTVIKA